jgi:hypothetical protein
MKRLFILLALILGIASAQAQIPAEVTDVMEKCRAAMTNPTGLEYEMDMKAGMGPVAMKMHFVVANKGNLNRTTVTTKVLGMEVITESGFDGTDTWEVNHASKGDTITITHGNLQKKSDDNLSLELDKKYNKAKMKHKDGYYEITFSEPKDKKNEAKSMTVKIAEKNYVIREMHTSARGARMTMNITKIRVGLKDNYFKLDLTKYPNAVIIRK